ncbi:MAG: 16S rRNA (cytosine(967)-C(5))-methyltransferase RsmB [Gammaproteobacteria bacterium]|nr:16S rRNA (cytosine(967)-C(5))-methyltransferase RsmB [Gammaproteobacteria bacterium]
MNTRKLAAQILERILIQGESWAKIELPTDLTPQDAAFVQALALGVLRYAFHLEALIQKLLLKPLKAKDQDINIVLMIGLFQLWRLQLPPHAVLFETVNAAPRKKSWAKSFINGVLREFLRQQPNLLNSLDALPNAPDWLVQTLRHAYPDQADLILHDQDIPAPMHLRINRLKTTRDHYLDLLSKAGIEILSQPDTPFYESNLTLKTPVSISQLPKFAEGWVSVQDLAAQQAARLLKLEDGQHVLDACAAPGGKTTHILESADVDLTALELDAKRAEKIHDNLKRLGLQAKVVCADATQIQPSSLFDRILLDAPCSGTGVIRRHPDIKVLRRPTDIESFSNTQLKLLQSLWPHLKPGGILLYATCSILPQENDSVIERFANEADFKVDSFTLERGRSTQFGWQLFPTPNGEDGFYYARLLKL